MAISSIVKPNTLIIHTHIKSLQMTVLISVRQSDSIRRDFLSDCTVGACWYAEATALWTTQSLNSSILTEWFHLWCQSQSESTLFSASDLSDCGLVSFPDGVFKMIRSCTDNIHKISLANNQIKALSSKFFLMFTQLRGKTVLSVMRWSFSISVVWPITLYHMSKIFHYILQLLLLEIKYIHIHTLQSTVFEQWDF